MRKTPNEPVERDSGPGRGAGISRRIVVMAEPAGDPRQRLVVLERDGGGGERDGRELRFTWLAGAEVIPVTEPVVHDVFLGPAREVTDVALHRFVVPAQRGVVARPDVVLPRGQDDGAAPFR